jgi:hypothetical protein
VKVGQQKRKKNLLYSLIGRAPGDDEGEDAGLAGIVET